MTGFIVTWDVDSNDSTLCARLRRFVFGYATQKNGRKYRYTGFVEREGVRYLGQSVLFATVDTVDELRAFLKSHYIDHVTTIASIGGILPN